MISIGNGEFKKCICGCSPKIRHTQDGWVASCSGYVLCRHNEKIAKSIHFADLSTNWNGMVSNLKWENI